jgi:hypothetical protein
LLGLLAGSLALPNIIHRRLVRRAAGMTALVVLLAMILGLNLSFAHYRDVFVLGFPNPEQRALSDVIKTPFVLHDVKSWWLGGIGLLFAFLSLLDGFKWDDPYPGYGEIARRREARREEYQDRKRYWLETLRDRRERARAEVGDLRHEIDMMQGEILQASLGRKSFTALFTAHFPHLESAANQLIETYRDANRRSRTTPAPSYFEQKWNLPKQEIAGPSEVDRDHLKSQIQGITASLSDALDRIHKTHDQTIAELDRLDPRKPNGTSAAQQLRLVG